MKIDRLFLDREIGRLDPNLAYASNTFGVARFLLASYVDGANIRKIARRTQEPISAIKALAERAREVGLWEGRSLAIGDYSEKDGVGMISLWADCLVMEGMLQKVKK